MSQRLVIRGGTVIDGTGASGRRADVLIEDNTIIRVGSVDQPDIQCTVIDLPAGHVVAPGFIDLHTHADYSVLAFPEAESALRQGITTIAVGNCGGGIAPISDEHDIRPVTFAFQPDWGVETSWREFPEYLAALDGLGVNVAAMVPHGALRNSVLGVSPRPTTTAELDTMKRMLSEAMEAGAVGMSTGLQYRPGCWSSPSEIRALVEVVGDQEGIYATHMRDRSESYLAAIDEAVEAARDTGAHLQLSHVVARPNALASEIDAALARMSEVEGRFAVDTFPEPWGPGLLVDLFPTELMEGETDEILARLANRDTRAAMEVFIDKASSFLARVAGYDEIFLSWVPGRPDLNGVSLGDVESIGSFCCDVLVAAGHRMREVGIRHTYANDEEIDRVLGLPFCLVASDGIVTNGEDEACPLFWSASTYGYTARVLENYVRDRGLLALEDAIAKMTALPARALGLSDRGSLSPGQRADLVVFDPATVHDRSTPVDMARHPEGFELVVVNGRIAFDGKRISDARAGRSVA